MKRKKKKKSWRDLRLFVELETRKNRHLACSSFFFVKIIVTTIFKRTVTNELNFEGSRTQQMVIQLSSHWLESTANRKRSSMTIALSIGQGMRASSHKDNICPHEIEFSCVEKKKENALFGFYEDDLKKKRIRRIPSVESSYTYEEFYRFFSFFV